MGRIKNLSVISTLLVLFGSVLAQENLFCYDSDCCIGQPEKTSLGDSNNCTMFYICKVSVPEPHSCPGTTNYDPATKICDVNVFGCLGGTRAPEGSTSTGATEISSIKPTESPIDGNCTENGAYFVPYPEDCRHYMICSGGTLLPGVQECPPGTLFDPELQECNLESLVECKPTCPSTETISLPHDSDCRLYWLCILGVATLKSCPVGLSFDSNLGTCNIEDVVLCPNLCPLEGTANMPHAKNCSLYWLCALGAPTLRSCPQNLLFDPSIGQCNLADQVNCAVYRFFDLIDFGVPVGDRTDNTEESSEELEDYDNFVDEYEFLI